MQGYILDNNIKNSYIIEDDIEIKNIPLFKFNISSIQNIIKSILNINNRIFITINSKIIKITNLYDYYNDNYIPEYLQNYNKISKINGPIVGTHFYYINYNMAKYLFSKCVNLTYQIDISIGILAYKY